MYVKGAQTDLPHAVDCPRPRRAHDQVRTLSDAKSAGEVLTRKCTADTAFRSVARDREDNEDTSSGGARLGNAPLRPAKAGGPRPFQAVQILRRRAANTLSRRNASKSPCFSSRSTISASRMLTIHNSSRTPDSR